MTKKQIDMLDLLKSASNHYRFLLAIICSNSFASYFQLIKESRSQNVLPVREERDMYDEYKRKFYSKKHVKRLGDAEDVKQVEVEADGDVKQVEIEDDGDVKQVEVEADGDAEDVKQIEDIEVDADDLEAEVEGDEFDDIALAKGVS
jgi:hypothetical protein